MSALTAATMATDEGGPMSWSHVSIKSDGASVPTHLWDACLDLDEKRKANRVQSGQIKGVHSQMGLRLIACQVFWANSVSPLLLLGICSLNILQTLILLDWVFGESEKSSLSPSTR
jgi:hypothetical protein